MTIAFVLGNGVSRQHLSLNDLAQYGTIYGCNALYREYTPDVLVATDKPIAEEIQKSGYSNSNIFYTRKPIPGLGAKVLPKQYVGYSSGPNAIGLASISQEHTDIFLLGFDIGGNMGLFNNMYADTDFYKKSLDKPTFSGNWIKQIATICNDHPNINYYRIFGQMTATIEQLTQVKNLRNVDLDWFTNMLNSKKA
jgi:hypothetical protein